MSDDLISRQAAIDAAIDAVDDWDGGYNVSRDCMIRDALNKLTSAQPETEERTAESVQNVSDSDLISRKVAIDAVYERIRQIGYENNPHVLSIRQAIRDLPTAQPEIIRCNSCKYWTQSTGKMKGYGLGRCDFHDADLVTCNGFCYWAERKQDE